MRIAIDAHAIGKRLTGNETYIRSLLHGLSALDQETEFVAYVTRDGRDAALPPRFQRREVSSNPFKRLGWDMPRHLRLDQPDLLHVQYTAPARCAVPVVVSVHDVSFLEHPEYFSAARVAQLRYTVRRTVRRSKRVLCPSEFSRQRILRAYGLDEERVVVASNAVASHWRPLPRESAVTAVRRRFGFDFPFVLTVGDLQPRKNHLRLVQAFADLLGSVPHLPHHLVVVGQDTWHAPKVHRAIAQSDAGERIHCPGFVSDEELVWLYNAADLLVFPSLYEGFGLPILEAMACGRAVACSSTSAMPEVAGGAALLFDPESPLQMTVSMRDLIVNRDFRVRQERAGLQRAAAFHWDRTAERTLRVYQEVVALSRPSLESKGLSVPVSRP